MQSPSAAPDPSFISAGQAPLFLAEIPAPAPVRGYDGAPLGHGRALVVDQASGQTLCLLVGRGRMMRRLRPIPWAALRYDSRLCAWRADVTADLFLQGPDWSGVGAGVRACVRRAHIYYDVYYDAPWQG